MNFYSENFYKRLCELETVTRWEGRILPTPYDIPAFVFIERLAHYLKENTYEIVPPPWSSFVKTGSNASRPPEDPEWWFIRCASVLRKIYLKGPIGVEHLRSEYGGRISHGNRPEHARKGSGAIVRKALQQLQAAGLVETAGNKGRVVTKEGRRLLDKLSTEAKEALVKTHPELLRY